MIQKVEVVFTPAGKPILPGSFSISPNPIEVEWNKSVTVNYVLTVIGDLREPWAFAGVSVGQNEPTTTSFIDLNDETQMVDYPGLGQVTISKLTERELEISVSNQSADSGPIELGTVLSLGKGKYRQSSRDPQIVLKPKT